MGYQTDTELDTKKEEKTKKQQSKKKKYRKRRVIKTQDNIKSFFEKVKDKDDVPKRLLKMEGLERQLNNKIKTIEKICK